MSIYVYDDNNPHPAGYHGIRVSVNKRQRYFKFKQGGQLVSAERQDELMREAQELEARWQEEEAVERKARRAQAQRNRAPDSPYSTGVAGINAVFIVDIKRRAGRLKSYFAPAFRLSCSHQGDVLNKSFRLTQGRSLAQQWEAAVRALATHVGIENIEPLLARQPEPELFEQVRQHMRRTLGHDIPAQALTPEVGELGRFANEQAWPTSHLVKMLKNIDSELARRDEDEVSSFEEGLRQHLASSSRLPNGNDKSSATRP